MITREYVRTMAVYNRWQNENLYGTAEALSDEVRKAQRGAFFGSIHATLNHLVWADQMWMSRFAGTPRPNAAGIPNSLNMYESWEDLKRERAAFDEVIIGWAEKLDPAWLEGDLTWFSGAAKREMTQAQGTAGGAHVQPPDAPPRPGALHAHAMRREARRYGPAVPRGLDGRRGPREPRMIGSPMVSRRSGGAKADRRCEIGRRACECLLSGERACFNWANASRTEEAPWISA